MWGLGGGVIVELWVCKGQAVAPFGGGEGAVCYLRLYEHKTGQKYFSFLSALKVHPNFNLVANS